MKNKKGSSSCSLARAYLDKEVTIQKLIDRTRNGAMREVLETARLWIESDEPIFIIGETGVGKNMLAQAIHNERNLLGKIQYNNFQEVTCTGIPETLFESEFFGHKKGAFTGAVKDKKGLAETASGGTLFLDEIGEISLALQAKLLRLVEQKRFFALGGEEELSTDVHIICATNKSLKELRNPEIFRTDMFYRLSLCLEIPPLRERVEDLNFFIESFFEQYVEETKNPQLVIEKETLKLLKSYSWPGNIRELKAALKRSVYSAAKSKVMLPKHLPPWICLDEDEGMTLEAAEKKHILKVYEMTKENVVRCSEVLDIARATLYRKLKGYGVIKGKSEEKD